uniref:Uncharacterized protein n=1 Tax=Rhizophora mucronata TaxID=61149 RepID=A0A2P2Q2P8_RHIMU
MVGVSINAVSNLKFAFCSPLVYIELHSLFRPMDLFFQQCCEHLSFLKNLSQ